MASAETMMSERQLSRIATRYRQEGVAGLAHRSRGQPSPRRTPEAELDQVMKRIEEEYHDFSPTLAHEMLSDQGEISFSDERLRQEMIRRGMHRPRRRKKGTIHQSRMRRPRYGELVQADGSPHDWFEGRGPECNLLVFVDDATSSVMQLWFAKKETTASYFEATRGYLKQHGKPVSLYVDKHSVFRVSSNRGLSADTSDSTGMTQFERAMGELDIEVICANSPQAKGRVEKLNQTLQDRLVKAMRLRGISDIKTANEYVPEFMDAYNQRFAKQPRQPENAHRPLGNQDDLGLILVERYQRVLSKNLECQFKNKRYQIVTERPVYALQHAPVMIEVTTDGTITIRYKGNPLAHQVMEVEMPALILNRKELDAHLDQFSLPTNTSPSPLVSVSH
jgi:hypothetical protein